MPAITMPPTLPSTSISGAFIAKLGAWLQLAQFIGFAGTAKGIMKAFEAMSSSTPSEDPGRLRMAIGEVLKSAFTGICISLIGILLILISIVVCRYRAVWLFWFLCIYGGLMIPTYFFPFGLFFLIYALVKKQEFLPAAPARLEV